MKLSTITAEDLSTIHNFFFDRLGFEFGELENMDANKMADLIVDEFKQNANFYVLFDYNSKELSAILKSLDVSEVYDSVVAKVTTVLESLGTITVESSMNSQQFIDEAIQQAKDSGTFVEKTETDKAAARRMNITVPQLFTLRSLKEKDRLTLTKEMNTKDKSGKNAKTKVVKFVTFNEKFDKGFVSLEYPKLKGWLPISMNASEFFRKTNTKVRKLTAAEVATQQAQDPNFVEEFDNNEELQQEFPEDDFDEEAWDAMNATKVIDNPNYDPNYDLNYDPMDEFNDDTSMLEKYLPTSQAIVAETPEQQQIANQEFMQQAVEEAEAAGQIVEAKGETDKAAAKRMNITEDQLKTLRQIPEKKLIPLKTPMSTKDRAGKSAKAKNIKFVSFNEKFEKGIVFLEYPHLKGWLVFSMGVSEFFRKTNIRLKK